MKSSWRVARIMGIDISIDWTWFIILFLMVYSLGFVEFPRELHPRTFVPRVDIVSITLGMVASLLLFASVLAHELSHSWMAIQRGIPVSDITLFIFGGIAQIADEPEKPASEFLIAIMGPLMSLALAAAFGAAWIWLHIADQAEPFSSALVPAVILTSTVAQANGALALFNLAPGFPLDGGRVLRAVLWAVLHDVRRATRWATFAGQSIAVLLALAGGYLFLTEFDGGGIWFLLVGLFLWRAASEGYRQALVREALSRVRVEELMTSKVETVPLGTTLTEFVLKYLLRRREQTFAVADGQVIHGYVSLAHVQRTPRAEWSTRCVQDIMMPKDRLAGLGPHLDAAQALRQLTRYNADELPVMDNGVLVGFIGRAELARFLKLRP